MEHDVTISVNEGVATQSDALAIKVKANEANMMKTKATNGLILAKMLLCKEIGIDLNSDITLADESLDAVPAPQMSPEKTLNRFIRIVLRQEAWTSPPPYMRKDEDGTCRHDAESGIDGELHDHQS